ncbi:MAG: futalosine hydrolase [Desulfovibrio sp.]|nr:MAG: futalosine hydrolase [Desulfovibrio sp.]
MAILLCTATAKEMKAVLKGLSLAESSPVQGQIKAVSHQNHEFLLLVTGVGPVNAALNMGAALKVNRVSLVVNPGIAGSFDLEQAPMGSAVAASTEIWPEYGVREDNRVEPRDIGLAQAHIPEQGGPVWDRVFLSNTDMLAKAGLAVPSGLVSGVSLTVAGVTADAQRAAFLKERHGALMENMEGFSVAYAAALSETPCVEIRTISNPVGVRDADAWDISGALKALSAIAGQLVK